MISKAAVAAVVLAGYSLAQQVPLQIIPPPATPTDINASGPPVPAPNDTAYPVPGPPAQAIGTINLSFTVGTPDLPVYPSIPLKGNFLGLSIELSVVDEILGKTPEKINVPFLNYMAAVAARAGMGPMIRIGGNTQDTAIYNDTSTTATAMIVKVSDHGFNPENGAPITPSIEYNDLVFQVMQGLAEKINSHYIWGLNMVNYTASFTEPMVKTLNSYVADQVELILVGNEPDRYTLTGNRDMSYDIPTYLNEWEDLTGRVMGDFGNAKVFTAPNVCCQWTTFQVTETNGMRERFSDRMGAISAIKCEWPSSGSLLDGSLLLIFDSTDPQSLCGMTPIGHEYYLNHTNTIDFAYYDADAITAAVNGGLPYYLVETNTASCIGLNGVSNAFTSALWGIDAALQMAFKNHTGVFFHTSGINTIYNVFTTPAYNASTKSWKTGPIFYSYLVVSEALASATNSSRVVDIGTGRDDAAAYAIYEEETVKKVVLVNMITGGENTWTANVPAPSDGAIVSYKLLTAPGVDAVQNIVSCLLLPKQLP